MSKKVITLIILFPQIGFAFSSSKKINLEKDSIEATACPQTLDKKKYSTKDDFENLIYLYSMYSCFPLKTTDLLFKHHSKKSWVFESLPKINLKRELPPEDRLRLLVIFSPFIKTKSLKEKNLTDTISLKKDLGLSVEAEQEKLYENFPSFDPKKQNQASLKVIKDYKRRGLHEKALTLLNKLYKKNPSNQYVQKQLISTQKNIKRDSNYLFYSQRFVDYLYNRYKNHRRHKYKRLDYLDNALLNIRRIWTYKSTDLALKKLKTLIKYHCIRDKECSEHYWILGRIYEEKSQTDLAHKWLKKAIVSTPRSSSEYTNRLWNLVWLESKTKGSQTALKTAQTFIKKLPEEEVSSKLYFWMSKWSQDKKTSQSYIDLLKKNHPLSFYAWSPLAVGIDFKIKKKKIKTIPVKKDYENELLQLTEAKLPELVRAYVDYAEDRSDFHKTMTWKKLKALNGMYADLYLDLQAGNIKIENHLPYFFSRSYENSVATNAAKQNLPKELIWSIIRQESNFNSTARSWADAFGLMQILEKRAVNYLQEERNIQRPRVTPLEMYDPDFNIAVGSWLLRKNLKIFSNKMPLAIAAYNANTEKVKEWETRFYNGDYLPLIEEITYRETRKYVKLVLRNIEIYKSLN